MTQAADDDTRAARRREYTRQYRAANRDKLDGQRRARRAANPEQDRVYTRRYRAANRDEINARAVARRAANRDEINARERARRAADPEKHRERERQRRAANPEKNREYQRRSRDKHRGRRLATDLARRRADPAGTRNNTRRKQHGLTPERWAAQWAAQHGLCYLCGRPIPAEPGPGVDIEHDHRCPHHGHNRSCGVCFRGLACSPCNRAIGLLGDDPERIITAGRNLAAARARVTARLLAEPPALFDASELTREATPQ